MHGYTMYYITYLHLDQIQRCVMNSITSLYCFVYMYVYRYAVVSYFCCCYKPKCHSFMICVKSLVLHVQKLCCVICDELMFVWLVNFVYNISLDKEHFSFMNLTLPGSILYIHVFTIIKRLHFWYFFFINVIHIAVQIHTEFLLAWILTINWVFEIS